MSKKPLTIDNVKRIELGKTTKAEVVKEFGKPQKESLTGNIMMACYLYISGADTQLLLLIYSPDDVVTDRSLNDERAKRECGDLEPRAASAQTRTARSGKKDCFIDIDCGVGYKCRDGVCTGGLTPQFNGRCQMGHFGKKYCTHNGKECLIDPDCLGS